MQKSHPKDHLGLNPMSPFTISRGFWKRILPTRASLDAGSPDSRGMWKWDVWGCLAVDGLLGRGRGERVGPGVSWLKTTGTSYESLIGRTKSLIPFTDWAHNAHSVLFEQS